MEPLIKPFRLDNSKFVDKFFRSFVEILTMGVIIEERTSSQGLSLLFLRDFVFGQVPIVCKRLLQDIQVPNLVEYTSR